MPKISVIIPVYNVEKYLVECLDSIINQTLKDIEIICVDDGSTDASGEILDKYALNDNRIKVIHKENSGAGASRNEGFKASSGKYILFFDSDDYLEFNALELMFNNSENTHSDITLARCFLLDISNKKIENKGSIDINLLQGKKEFAPLEIRKYIFQFCVGWPWDKLYRRDFIEHKKLIFQNLRQSNDTSFVLLSLALANKISYIDDYLCVHRENRTSLSNTRYKAPGCFYEALIGLMDGMKKHNIYHDFEQSFINYSISFPLWHITTMKNKNCQNLMIARTRSLFEFIKIKKIHLTYFYNIKQYCEIMIICYLWQGVKIIEFVKLLKKFKVKIVSCVCK